MAKSKLVHVVFWAFTLNTIWEFGQCIYFYNMWSWPFWKATFWMWAAIFGDILIVLGLWKITTMLLSTINFYRPKITGYAVLLFISFITAIFLEWIAIVFGLWEYDPSMPTLIIGNHRVGILPMLQITILPALSIFVADRFCSN